MTVPKFQEGESLWGRGMINFITRREWVFDHWNYLNAWGDWLAESELFTTNSISG